MDPQGSVLDVRVRVLGGFEVEGLTRHQLGSRKARTLLKLLALARARPVAIDHLIECLWPSDEAAPSRPDEQLAVLMSRLRAVLGPERLVREPERLVRRRRGRKTSSFPRRPSWHLPRERL